MYMYSSWPDVPLINDHITQALAQDQKTALEKLLLSCPGLEHIQVQCFFQMQQLDLKFDNLGLDI